MDAREDEHQYTCGLQWQQGYSQLDAGAIQSVGRPAKARKVVRSCVGELLLKRLNTKPYSHVRSAIRTYLDLCKSVGWGGSVLVNEQADARMFLSEIQAYTIVTKSEDCSTDHQHAATGVTRSTSFAGLAQWGERSRSVAGSLPAKRLRSLVQTPASGSKFHSPVILCPAA